MPIGTKVETPYGIGVIEHKALYSIGTYYDVRLENGELVKVFNTEVQEL